MVVTLTLTFTPDSGADDPTVVFSSGGRTARITVPAGSTNGATDVGVQTGTVAGVITITAQMQASGQDVTPIARAADDDTDRGRCAGDHQRQPDGCA